MAEDPTRVPSFARDFPRDPELDALVEAFAKGNYARVREEAPKLAKKAESEEVRRAAKVLRERLEPDPLAKSLLLLTAALLVAISSWYILRPPPRTPPEERKIEYVK
jgi:hypothetical protein